MNQMGAQQEALWEQLFLSDMVKTVVEMMVVGQCEIGKLASLMVPETNASPCF